MTEYVFTVLIFAAAGIAFGLGLIFAAVLFSRQPNAGGRHAN